MKNLRDLMVGQKAHALRLPNYRGKAEFPKQEIYALTDQIRRCSASIAANMRSRKCWLVSSRNWNPIGRRTKC